MKEKKLNQAEGQGLAEYALILVLVAIVVIVVLSVLGPAVGNVFSSILDNPFEAGITIEEAPFEGPADCYGSFLMPLMVLTSGAVMLLSRYLPTRFKEIPLRA